MQRWLGYFQHSGRLHGSKFAENHGAVRNQRIDAALDHLLGALRRAGLHFHDGDGGGGTNGRGDPLLQPLDCAIRIDGGAEQQPLDAPGIVDKFLDKLCLERVPRRPVGIGIVRKRFETLLTLDVKTVAFTR